MFFAGKNSNKPVKPPGSVQGFSGSPPRECELGKNGERVGVKYQQTSAGKTAERESEVRWDFAFCEGGAPEFRGRPQICINALRREISTIGAS